jgi:hypothetical protein
LDQDSEWSDVDRRHFQNSKQLNYRNTASENNWKEAYKRHYAIAQEMNKIEAGKSSSSITGSTLSANEITGLSWEKAEQRHFDQPNTVDEKKFELTDEYSRENIIEAELNKFRKHEFNAAWQLADYEYKEPDVMHLGGTMYGFKSSYTYRPSHNDPLYNKIINLYRLDGQFNSMTVDYEAFGDQYGLRSLDIKDWMYEIRAILGKEYYDKLVRVLFYTGFGYRYLMDDGGGELNYNPNDGNYYFSYDRESNYYYLPIGAEVEFPGKNNWSLTLKGEYDLLFYGQQFSQLSDGNQFQPSSDYYSEDITNNQNQGFGLKGSIEIARKLELLDVFVEPFFDYWNIEGSDIAHAVVVGDEADMWEPPNRTITWGARMGIKF